MAKACASVCRPGRRTEEPLLTGSGRGKKPDPGAGCSAGHESQNHRTDLVQPRHVVDHDENGSGGSRSDQQLQGGTGDRHPVRSGSLTNAEGAVKSSTLQFIEPIQVLQYRIQHLMQAGETDVSLELGSRCAEHDEPGRSRVGGCRVDQHGLPDPCLTGDQERAAVVVRTVEEGADDTELQVTSDQLYRRAPGPLASHPPSLPPGPSSVPIGSRSPARSSIFNLRGAAGYALGLLALAAITSVTGA